jgi:hypothetical protein
MSNEYQNEPVRGAWISEEGFLRLKSLRTAEDEESGAALGRLIADASQYLNVEPYTVMNKKVTPPSNDKHDYMSLSIYNWPNPDTADGLPYVTRDGYVNPEVNDYDRPLKTAMCTAVEALTLAYVATAEDKWAAKAIELLDVWFLRPDTRMNPNMWYAQYIPGNGGFDRPARYPAVYVPGVEGKGVYVAFGGVIEGIRFIPLVNVIPLLEDCPLWEKEMSIGLRSWFKEYLHWLLDSQHGKDEAGCLNNHGSWYCNQIVAYASFVGETQIVTQFLENQVKERISMQIEPDGSQPQELVRAGAYHYVTFALTSFFNLAYLAGKQGIDLWNYTTSDGRGLRQGLDWFMPYIKHPDSWPYRSVESFDSLMPETAPVLYMAYEAYKDPVYLELMHKLEHFPEDHRYRLLFPV